MARLTAAQRNALPDSDFAIPSKRKYPVEDAAHQANALSRVSRFGSPAEKKAVRAKVAKERGESMEEKTVAKMRAKRKSHGKAKLRK